MKSHNIRLIDNTYDLDIARQLVEGPLDQKMRFIEQLLNDSDPLDVMTKVNLEGRLEDLKAEKRSLELLMDEYDGEHVEMEIACTMVMSLKRLEVA